MINKAMTVLALNDNSPVFTSSMSFIVSENSSSVGAVVATDADAPSQSINFSLSGGVDQNKLSLSAGGALTLLTPPDFEDPDDSGADHIYNVQITANDGNGGLTVQSITVIVTNLNDSPLVFSTPIAFSVLVS